MHESAGKCGEVVLSGILLAGCAVLAIAAFQIQTVESRLLPLAAISIIAICTVWNLVQTVVWNKPSSVRLVYKKRELIVWGMFVALVLLIRFLGFYSAAFLFLFACHLYLTGHVNKKSVLKSLAYSAILDLALYMSFTLAVRMSLPRGLLF